MFRLVPLHHRELFEQPLSNPYTTFIESAESLSVEGDDGLYPLSSLGDLTDGLNGARRVIARLGAVVREYDCPTLAHTYGSI
jgi:hypothetical protein